MVNKECPTSLSDSLDGSVATATQYKPAPLTYRAPAPSYVDKVLVTCNEYDSFLVKVMRPHRTPICVVDFSFLSRLKSYISLFYLVPVMLLTDESEY